MDDAQYFLIIDHEKTGSTCPQQRLIENREMLLDAGIAYTPADGAAHSADDRPFSNSL